MDGRVARFGLIRTFLRKNRLIPRQQPVVISYKIYRPQTTVHSSGASTPYAAAETAHWVCGDWPTSQEQAAERSWTLTNSLIPVYDFYLRRIRRPAKRLCTVLLISSTKLAYLAAILAVSVLSSLMMVVKILSQGHIYVESIAFLYFVVVLWLGTQFGRGPAVCASAISCPVYALFFVPPVHRLAGGALLVVSLGLALVIISKRARAAIESQRHLAGLINLAQLVASTPDEEALLKELARNMLQHMKPLGVKACSINAPDSTKALTTLAVQAFNRRDESLVRVEGQREQTEAAWSYKHGRVSIVSSTRARRPRPDSVATYFTPLRQGDHVVGVIGICGPWAAARLARALCLHGLDTAGSVRLDEQLARMLEMLRVYCNHAAATLDRMKWHQEAIQAQARDKSDHLKNALLGTITHNLKTPVAAAKGTIERLLTSGCLDGPMMQQEQIRGHVHVVQMQIDRLDRVVTNALELVRIQEGVAKPEKQWHPIGDLISSALVQMEEARKIEQNRQIEVDVPGALPMVQVDGDQMEVVLSNLIENALLYSPPESQIRIHASVLPTTPCELMVQVSDDGDGIPPEDLPYIFDKFHRAHQRARSVRKHSSGNKGAGLGLAICEAIIKLHGGRIWGESPRGQGATISFTLPIPSDPPPPALPVD